MTKLILSSALILLTAIQSPKLTAQTADNFSGTWTIDTSKSTPGPGGQFMDADQILRITQNSGSITFKRTYPSSGNFVTTYKYLFDGKVKVDKRDIGTIKTSVAWSDDKKVLTVSTVTTAETKDGPADFLTTDTWRLSDDGRALLNKSVSESQQLGRDSVLTVYRKK